MIKFFRKIRYDLMDKNKTGKYLKYAIGEIVLVVIGILIALSINNWNNERQNDIRKTVYLEGIKNDLTHDTEFIKEIIPGYEKRIQEFNRIDSLVRIKYDSIFQIEFREIRRFSNMMRTFYPRIGSYASLVSENSTALISNDSLSKRLRNIYDIQYFRIGSLGQKLDDIANQISWERRLDFRHKFTGYDHQDYDTLFADLDEMNDDAYWVWPAIEGSIGHD
jgi:hypothetical protein